MAAAALTIVTVTPSAKAANIEQARPGTDSIPSAVRIKWHCIKDPLSGHCFVYQSDGKRVWGLSRFDCQLWDAMIGKTQE